MSTLTITAKGQVTLKKSLLKHLGVAPGDKVSVDLLPNGNLKIAAGQEKGNIAAIFGILKSDDQPAHSIDDINKIIAKGWSGKL